eukprot:1149775-Pelagomonas_calceolata.AAC.14
MALFLAQCWAATRMSSIGGSARHPQLDVLVLGGSLSEQQVAVVSDAIQSLIDEFQDKIPVDDLQLKRSTG